MVRHKELDGSLRNSGARIIKTVYKTGLGMAQQGQRMQTRPDVYAPVIFITETGYAMPVLRHIDNAHEVLAALEALRRLWRLENLHWKNPPAVRKHYHIYVMTRQAPRQMLYAAEQWYQLTCNQPGTAVVDLHGDATIENAMMLTDSNAVWIDPSTRFIAKEAEADIGKVLQSLHGYHDMPHGSIEAIRLFLDTVEFNMELAMYYLATHLVRLWRHQPEKRDWAVQIAKEVLSA